MVLQRQSSTINGCSEQLATSKNWAYNNVLIVITAKCGHSYDALSEHFFKVMRAHLKNFYLRQDVLPVKVSYLR